MICLLHLICHTIETCSISRCIRKSYSDSSILPHNIIHLAHSAMAGHSIRMFAHSATFVSSAYSCDLDVWLWHWNCISSQSSLVTSLVTQTLNWQTRDWDLSSLTLYFSGKILGYVSSYRVPIFMVKRKWSFKPFISPFSPQIFLNPTYIKIKVSRKNIHFPYSRLTFWVKKNGSIFSIFSHQSHDSRVYDLSFQCWLGCHKNIC